MQVVFSRRTLVATVTITGAAPTGPIVVSWGDGSAQDALTTDATGAVSDSHTYASAGTYAITATDMTTKGRHYVALPIFNPTPTQAAANAAGSWQGSYAYP
jgi:hypothetical protein